MLIIAAILVAIGGDLFFINASTGGAGVLPLAGLIACSLALLSSWRIGFIKALSMLFGRAKALLAWTGIGILLPALGVLSGFPVRTIATALAPLGILAFVWLGATEQAAGTDVGAVVRRTLIPLLWIVLIVGLSQGFLYHGIGIPFIGELVNFLDERLTDGRWVVIHSRASGFYGNPNTLSFCGGLTAVLAFGDRQASWAQRIMMLIPSLGLMAIGQSRMAILACLASLMIYALGFLSPGLKYARGFVGLILAVTFSLTLVVLVTRVWAPEVWSGLAERLSSMMGATARGGPIDASVEGRVKFWSHAWSQFVNNPMGTLGPPQVVLGSSIDNEYISTLVQGGVIYLLAEIWVVIAAFTAAGSRALLFSRIAVVYVFLAGLSQSIASLAPTTILWILFGTSLWSPDKTRRRNSHA